MVEMLREVGSLTRQETFAARDMAALPARDQADFWLREFRPLLVKDAALREKAIALLRRHEALIK